VILKKKTALTIEERLQQELLRQLLAEK